MLASQSLCVNCLVCLSHTCVTCGQLIVSPFTLLCCLVQLASVRLACVLTHSLSWILEAHGCRRTRYLEPDFISGEHFKGVSSMEPQGMAFINIPPSLPEDPGGHFPVGSLYLPACFRDSRIIHKTPILQNTHGTVP